MTKTALILESMRLVVSVLEPLACHQLYRIENTRAVPKRTALFMHMLDNWN